ncbi:MAG: TlpA family protein disulfide reductase [Treponema sp.]|jgi:thiol-disulfide isomerase/thioredoxin|nr:TlpA family protein disulfide reductase [Treponema sp.]
MKFLKKARFLALLALCSSVLWAEGPPRTVAAAFTRAGLRTERELMVLPGFSAPLANVPGSSGSARLEDYRGKVLFLNLWATWCGPCRAEMPSMEKLYRRFREQGLEMLALNIQEQKADVEAFMRRNGLTFPAALDADGRIARQYGVMGIPTSYILDRQGRVILRLVGSINWDDPKIFAAFEALLAE